MCSTDGEAGENRGVAFNRLDGKELLGYPSLEVCTVEVYQKCQGRISSIVSFPCQLPRLQLLCSPGSSVWATPSQTDSSCLQIRGYVWQPLPR